MGMTVYCSLYPKECEDKAVLPFLNPNPYWTEVCELNGKHLGAAFWDACRKYGREDKEEDCYVLGNPQSLWDFAAEEGVPDEFSDGLSTTFSEDTPLLIIWVR